MQVVIFIFAMIQKSEGQQKLLDDVKGKLVPEPCRYQYISKYQVSHQVLDRNLAKNR